jgi:hypothetical protein
MTEITQITKLEAVNAMLDAIGEDPVNSLGSGQSDAELALRKLNEISRDVQAVGWDFNTETSTTLSPDNSNTITLAPNVLKFDTVDEDAWRKIVVRGQRLYDKDNFTFTFDKAIQADVVYGYDFEELPHMLRAYVLARAGRVFQEGAMGSVALDGFTARREEEAWTRWLEDDTDTDDSNILRSSPTARDIAYRNNRRWGR